MSPELRRALLGGGHYSLTVTDDSAIARLQRWYFSRCDGEWEHSCGIEIGTLDNPGWRVHVDLADTDLDGRAFDRLDVERSDADWLRAWVEDRRWQAACGPLNLGEAVDTFLCWAELPSK